LARHENFVEHISIKLSFQSRWIW